MTDTAQPVASEYRVVALSDLRPHPRNYQKHPDDQREHIRRSLLDFGQYKNVVAARDLTILAGHGVIEGMTSLGWTHADVRVLDLDPDSPLALRLVAGDNEISNLADVDDRALTELLREISADPLVGLLGSGFDHLQLAALAMTTRPASELRDLAAAGEWLGLPGFKATDKEPLLVVKFQSDEDRDRFLAEIVPGQQIIKKSAGGAWTTYWPSRGMNDLAAIRFEPGGSDAAE
jgi:hypothetical protein